MILKYLKVLCTYRVPFLCQLIVFDTYIMIHLERNSTNIFPVTVSELMTDAANDLKIEFINETTKDSYETILGSNLSPAQGRYDEFQLILPDDIDLPLNGFYIYTIYEIDSETLDVVGILETGRANITGSFDTNVHTVYQ